MLVESDPLPSRPLAEIRMELLPLRVKLQVIAFVP